jgi:hypothetical protein
MNNTLEQQKKASSKQNLYIKYNPDINISKKQESNNKDIEDEEKRNRDEEQAREDKEKRNRDEEQAREDKEKRNRDDEQAREDKEKRNRDEEQAREDKEKRNRDEEEDKQKKHDNIVKARGIVLRKKNCIDIMCKSKIKNIKDFRKFALTNSPDKVENNKSLDEETKKKLISLYSEIVTCNQDKTYCDKADEPEEDNPESHLYSNKF